MNKYKISIMLVISTILFSCEKVETDVDTSLLPVVESYLTPGKIISVKITKTIENTSGKINTAEPIEGLSVKVSTNETTYLLIYKGNGVYKSDSSEVVKQGLTYKLEFAYNSKTVTATTDMPTNPSNFTISATSVKAFSFDNISMGSMPTIPDPVKVKWKNTDGKYYLVVVKNIEANPSLINTSENAPDLSAFRSSPDNASSEYDITPMSYKYYGQHYVILYKLNYEYAQLYNDNGTSSQNITSPYTNVNNGLGIFTGVAADTLTLKVVK
jgi:hypothetical protein